MRTNPEALTVDVFLDLFQFLWEYVVRVMFLPGQIVQWNTILNMGNLSATALPRDLVLNFGRFCQKHCLYHMKKANYLQVSWAQNIFYRTFRWMINPETLKKMLVT